MERKFEIDGGRGVGRVTKKGLDQPVGAAAINKVPRQMIRKEAEEICDAMDTKEDLRSSFLSRKENSLRRRRSILSLELQVGFPCLGQVGLWNR